MPPEPIGQPSSPARAPSAAPVQRESEQADTRPAGQALVILYASRSQAAQAAAEQLAPRLGLTPGQIDTRAAPDTPSRAIIRFYERADHALARRIGQEFSRMGYSWRIENLSDRSPSKHQAPEIWLPEW